MDKYNYSFLCSVYVGDSTFFLKDELSVIETMKVFEGLILFSGFRPNKSKCEVFGMENGLERITLFLNSIKSLRICFCCIKQIENKEKFIKSIFQIEKFLKYWQIVNLAIEGKVFILKALAVSKIIHLPLVINKLIKIIKSLNKIQK